MTSKKIRRGNADIPLPSLVQTADTDARTTSSKVRLFPRRDERDYHEIDLDSVPAVHRRHPPSRVASSEEDHRIRRLS